MQGFPIHNFDLSRASKAAMHDLSGNAFSGTVFLAVLLAITVNIPELSVGDSERVAATLDEITDLIGMLDDA